MTKMMKRISRYVITRIYMMPKGYHTVVSALGYTTYYLWFLAGNQRLQVTVDDPQVGWVTKTIGILKELGR